MKRYQFNGNAGAYDYHEHLDGEFARFADVEAERRLTGAIVKDLGNRAIILERERIALAAENARLRAALERLVEHGEGCISEPDCGSCKWCDAVAALAKGVR